MSLTETHRCGQTGPSTASHPCGPNPPALREGLLRVQEAPTRASSTTCWPYHTGRRSPGSRAQGCSANASLRPHEVCLLSWRGRSQLHRNNPGGWGSTRPHQSQDGAPAWASSPSSTSREEAGGCRDTGSPSRASAPSASVGTVLQAHSSGQGRAASPDSAPSRAVVCWLDLYVL